MHRMKCRNSQCAFEGMMEAKSDQPFLKKAFLDKRTAALQSKGIAAAAEVMQVRCPKCGTRWRMRADQLRSWFLVFPNRGESGSAVLTCSSQKRKVEL